MVGAVLITGGAGYTGQYLLRHFAASGLHVSRGAGPEGARGGGSLPAETWLIGLVDSSPALPSLPPRLLFFGCLLPSQYSQVGFTYQSCKEPQLLTCAMTSAYKVPQCTAVVGSGWGETGRRLP